MSAGDAAPREPGGHPQPTAAPTSPLDLTASERAALGRAALDFVLKWFEYPPDRRLYPAVTESELRAALDEPVPLEGTAAWQVLADFERDVITGAKDNANPRHFGYVQSSHAFVAVVGDFLASAINQNETSWRSAPAATTVERETIGWIRSLVGFGTAGEGILVSGGSTANFVGLGAALAHAAPDVAREGVRSLPGEPVVYASRIVHMSIPKAVGMLGLGRKAVRLIDVDAQFRIDVSALDRAIEEDLRAGRLPVCIVANAGDVNTGAVDPLEQLAEVAGRRDVWLHADGAYGGFAAMAASGRGIMRGLDRVDSVSLDPHKWLYVPLDAGCILVRDAASLARGFSYAAEYVDVIATTDMSKYVFWDYGPELSRRFRALKIWLLFKCHGAHAIAEAIEHNIRLARRLGDMVDAAADFERLAPVPLSIVCFRYVTQQLRDAFSSPDTAACARARDEANALNQAVMLKVQTGGVAYLSNTMIDGAFALRACIVNHRTREEDLEILLREIRMAADAVCRQA